MFLALWFNNNSAFCSLLVGEPLNHGWIEPVPIHCHTNTGHAGEFTGIKRKHITHTQHITVSVMLCKNVHRHSRHSTSAYLLGSVTKFESFSSDETPFVSPLVSAFLRFTDIITKSQIMCFLNQANYTQNQQNYYYTRASTLDLRFVNKKWHHAPPHAASWVWCANSDKYHC